MREGDSHAFYGSFSGEFEEQIARPIEEDQTIFSSAPTRRSVASSWVALVVVALVGLYAGVRHGGSASIVSLDIIDELVRG